MPPIPTDAVRGRLELLVLAVLDGEPGHGYEIAQRLHARSGGAFAVQEGSLYPTLHRLENEKLLRSQWQKGEGGPRRRVYELTARGRRELSGQTSDWYAIVAAVRSVIGPEPA